VKKTGGFSVPCPYRLPFWGENLETSISWGIERWSEKGWEKANDWRRRVVGFVLSGENCICQNVIIFVYVCADHLPAVVGEKGRFSLKVGKLILFVKWHSCSYAFTAS